jgi:hypothetical protein
MYDYVTGTEGDLAWTNMERRLESSTLRSTIGGDWKAVRYVQPLAGLPRAGREAATSSL